MQTIHIHTQLDSTTLHLPQVQPLLGKRVEIIVREELQRQAASEQEWIEFFAKAGTDLIDADLVQKYREFDRRASAAPTL
jgi:hypothetical protein